MNRCFLALAFAGIFQLCSLLNPALAGAWYRTDLSSCMITDIGNQQWKVTFNMNTIVMGNGPAIGSGEFNYLVIKIPAISGNVMSRTNFVWSPVPVKDISLPSGVAVRGTPSIYAPGLVLAPPGSGPLLLVPSAGTKGRVEFTITPTAENKAYPAAVVSVQARNTTGEGVVGNYWFIPNYTTGSCSFGSGSNPPVTPPPVTELMPVDPEFTMNSVEWMLQTTDVGDIPNVTSAGTGYPVTINNVNNNNLCVRYVTAGVASKQYALAVTNSASSQAGRNLFTLPGPDSSQLFYNLQLSNNDGNTAKNFNFPTTGTPNYITLEQKNNYSSDHSEICWTPKINLFKNSSTKEGLHSDTLNFIITPKA
ncbi:hypothetical protein A6U95_06500 [Serratia sp. 14-2641]|nr:hypothetical protein A6U95_06500 [Serratia sp. 14-2641]